MSCLGRSIDKWGPAAWNTLHTFAFSLPETITEEDDEAFRAFLSRFGMYLPCQKCSLHFQEYVQHTLADRHFKRREEVIEYLNDFHNAVNVRNGKRPFSLKEHMRVYGIRPRIGLVQRATTLIIIFVLLSYLVRGTSRTWF